jgi:ribosomal protein S6 kinase beta
VLDSPVTTPAAGGQDFVGFTYVRPAPILEEGKPSSSRIED